MEDLELRQSIQAHLSELLLQHSNCPSRHFLVMRGSKFFIEHTLEKGGLVITKLTGNDLSYGFTSLVWDEIASKIVEEIRSKVKDE
jgi:hypothetical protein